jgi:pyrroloquinoline quinone biosynthesis protein D
MSQVAQNSVLRLAPGCRLTEHGAPQDLLLIPEGALRMQGPARRIVELCDGKRPVSEIVEELQRRYGTEDAARIETETVALLTRLRERGVLESV